MNVLLPVVAVAAMATVIYILGSGAFGRAQTQKAIDRFRAWGAVYTFLDRHHGKFRAAAHYLEFGGLFLVLYWLQAALLEGSLVFRWGPALAVAAICILAAFLDEMHQLRSGTRQFRRVDFLHSTCGVAIAMAMVYLQMIWRLGG